MNNQQIRRYRRALRQFERLVGKQLRFCSCGVTFAQCLVMLEIHEHARLSMGKLAEHLRLDQTTLSRSVDGLVRKRLVSRLRDDQDRRVVWVQLTEAGIAKCLEIHEKSDAFCNTVFKNIPYKERSIVIRNFETLVNAYIEQESTAGSD